MQRLRRLSRRRSARSEEGAFLADGPVLLAEALRAGAPVRAVYADAEMLHDPVVRTARDAGVPVTETADGTLAKVLDLKTPQGVVALVERRSVDLAPVLDDASSRARPVLVLVGLQDPGNVGTLVRVAEAAGCAGVVMTPGSVDVANPKTVRATAGAVFRVPVVEQVEIDQLLDACSVAGVSTRATVGRGGVPLDEVPLGGAVAVLVGSEAHGLPADVVRRCAGTLTVPMDGAVESLNAAIAGSVVLFEAARQRRSATGERRTVSDPSGGGTSSMGHNDRM